MKTFLQRSLFSVAATMMAAAAFSQTVYVSECAMGDWHRQPENDTRTFASIIASPTYGVRGSGFIKGGSDNDNARFTTGRIFAGTELEKIGVLKYSTYVPGSSVNGKAPIIILSVSTDNPNNAAEEWVFDPSIQGASKPVELDKWQDWDALAGQWYSIEKLTGSASKKSELMTWGELIEAVKAKSKGQSKPNDKKEPSPPRLTQSHTIVFAAGLKGNAWTNYEGYIDMVVIGEREKPSTTYDFITGATELACPAPVSRPADLGSCSATVTLTAPTIIDACGASITATGNRKDGASLDDAYPVGTTEVTWTFPSGTSCIQFVTVVDEQDPTLSVPVTTLSANTSEDGTGDCTVNILIQDATFGDNCTGAVLSWGMTGASQASGIGQIGTYAFSAGTTTITYTVTDAAMRTVTKQVTVTVVDDEDPVVTAADDIATTTSADGKGDCAVAVAIPDATYDDNCTVATLTWAMTGATVANSAATGINQVGTYTFNKGTTTITYTVTDAAGRTKTDELTVSVIDDEAPVISNVSASPNTLWSPNHKMVDVYLTYEVTDNCDNPVADANIIVESITSNEPLNDLGDGNTEQDWEIVDNKHIELRAERAGLLEGRIYTITIKATDAAGNSSTATVTVTVPHDQSKKEAMLDVVTGSNPSSGSFTLKVNSTNIEDQITMVVSNASGNVVYSRKDLKAGQTIDLGSNFQKGMYYVSFRQGSAVKQVQLLKL